MNKSNSQSFSQLINIISIFEQSSKLYYETKRFYTTTNS
ncbi:hypothetical protein A1OE_481 [Candidatus Endolissoclinum faulkneri L2]|uniref:Uncharacterized protein n=1 Tax=Candidatus Endolissoclinum faulkneri L2 TaxID=1193729 RepID=K7YQ16_9PROT|nr:hypothetical protein A1OE_481 [Candidatus Endolissoclinum faulkneri L2]